MLSKPILGFVLAAIGSVVACAAPTDADGSDDDGAGAQASAWDAESADHESKSTHLWIVNRAIDILARHTEDPQATSAARVLSDPACRTHWQQGLLDADFKAAYNNGRSDMPLEPNDAQVALAGATWESHFYDPHTGKNYKGKTSPTAFTESQAHLKMSYENHLGKQTSTACYELGLALHYFTDLTQPMHAANFTAVDRPAKLHSNLEGYSMEIQDRFPLHDWTGKPTGEVKDFINQTAKDSWAMFNEGVVAVVHAYKRSEWNHGIFCRDIDADPLRFIGRQHVDYKECWAGDWEVDALVGKTLTSAQDHTAKFIYLVGAKMERP